MESRQIRFLDVYKRQEFMEEIMTKFRREHDSVGEMEDVYKRQEQKRISVFIKQ